MGAPVIKHIITVVNREGLGVVFGIHSDLLSIFIPPPSSPPLLPQSHTERNSFNCWITCRHNLFPYFLISGGLIKVHTHTHTHTHTHRYVYIYTPRYVYIYTFVSRHICFKRNLAQVITLAAEWLIHMIFTTEGFLCYLEIKHYQLNVTLKLNMKILKLYWQ